MIKTRILFSMGKLKFSLLWNFHPCSVIRASINQTMKIHSINFSSVLRAACKYELALISRLVHEARVERLQGVALSVLRRLLEAPALCRRGGDGLHQLECEAFLVRRRFPEPRAHDAQVHRLQQLAEHAEHEVLARCHLRGGRVGAYLLSIVRCAARRHALVCSAVAGSGHRH